MKVIAPGRASTPPQTVEVTIPAGPSRTLTATATSDYHTKRVRITNSGGGSVVLGRLEYVCVLPPSPTICPPTMAKYSRGKYHLRFTALRAVPVELVGIVGPPPAAKVAQRKAPNRKAPTYRLEQLVETVTPPPKSAPKGTKSTISAPSTTAGVVPRQSVEIVTQLVGQEVGRQQLVTVTIPRRSGLTLTMTGKVEDGKLVRSTVTSANGHQIRLVYPYYSCFLGMDRSVCPSLKVRVLPEHTAIVYAGSPYTPPLVLLATVAPAPPSVRPSHSHHHR